MVSELSRDEIRSIMKEEYQEAQKSGANVTIKELADKYGIPPGTARRWKKEDDWDSSCERVKDVLKKKQNERSPERSEKQANVREKKSNHAKYDWENLRLEFVRGKFPSLKAFAESHGIPPDVLYQKSSEEDWTRQKSAYVQEVLKESIRLDAESLHETRLKNLYLLDQLSEQVQSAIPGLNSVVLKGQTTTTTETRMRNHDAKFKDKTGTINSTKADTTQKTVDKKQTVEVVEGITDPKNLKYMAETIYRMQQAQFESYGKDLIEGGKFREKDINITFGGGGIPRPERPPNPSIEDGEGNDS